ncbi:MAG: zinc ribbon domain-containing protein [Candidatus Omnitrophota bacterium]
MPLYAYYCKKCSEKFDLLLGMSQEKTELKCPACKSKKIEKVFAPFRVGGSSSEKNSSSKCGSCSGGSCSGCH